MALIKLGIGRYRKSMPKGGGFQQSGQLEKNDSRIRVGRGIFTCENLLGMTTTTNNEGLRYESSRKHKEPWQSGRRGSLCPKDICLDRAKQMLKDSIAHGRQRYAVDSGRPFAGQDNGSGVWHGYPVGWSEVPETVRNDFQKTGLVKRHDINRNWKRAQS